MNFNLRLTIPLLAALAGPGLFCTHDDPVTGIEVTNGDCSGTIYQQDSTVAAGAVVRLIPANYDPGDPSTGTVDSTTTDRAGRYAFDVDKADFYNIIAEKNGASSISESVPLQPEASVVVNDTLTEPGKLAGRISVKPEDDARNIIILIRGTNIFAAPIDSAGNFATPPLPAGTYKVRIFFIGTDEYAPCDTTVTVFSGETTELFVTLPSTNAPSIAGLSVRYDSVTMFATISWAKVDTSQIESYILDRTSNLKDPVKVIIEKTADSYLDDLVFSEGETVVYHLAAIGKNFKTGLLSSSDTIAVRSALRCINTISLQYDFFDWAGGYKDVLIDQSDNIFVTDNSSIQKFDLNGTQLKSYFLPADSNFTFMSQLQADDLGNLYCLNRHAGSELSIIKFNRDLEIISQSPAIDSMADVWHHFFTILGDGSFLLISNISVDVIDYRLDCVRRIRTFDAQYNKKEDYSIEIDSMLIQLQRFGDTIVARTYDVNYRYLDYNNPADQLWIDYYDISFRQTGTLNTWDILKPFIPSTLKLSLGDASPVLGPAGLMAWSATDFNSTILLITESNQHLRCRCRKQPGTELFFDSRGNPLIFTSSYVDNTMTLNRYSLPQATASRKTK